MIILELLFVACVILLPIVAWKEFRDINQVDNEEQKQRRADKE